MVDLGDMRERVKIQRETRTDDTGGGASIAWVDIASVWASVAPISSSENLRAMAIALNISHKVTMRWREELGTLDGSRYRLEWRGQPMHINGVFNPDKQRRFLEISCTIGGTQAS